MKQHIQLFSLQGQIVLLHITQFVGSNCHVILKRKVKSGVNEFVNA